MAFASKEKGRIKMVVLTANGFPNITWYSPDRENRKPDDMIITGMLRRYSNQDSAKNAQVIQFFANDNGVPGAKLREFKVK
jgi:hypothetical protein